jgi:hypothetical protein
MDAKKTKFDFAAPLFLGNKILQIKLRKKRGLSWAQLPLKTYHDNKVEKYKKYQNSFSKKVKNYIKDQKSSRKNLALKV